MDTLEHLLKSLFIMASMVEARDPYTGGHLWRVSQFCRVLAEHGGLPPNQVARVSLGGFLHDLGKIAVPDAIRWLAARSISRMKRGQAGDESVWWSNTRHMFTASQHHPEGGLPIITGGLIVHYDASGVPRFERNCSASFTGSHDTAIRIGCDGFRVSLSGNVGRFSRQDNLFNYGWEGTKAACERILSSAGLPIFTASSGIREHEDFRRGAVVSRLDVTANYETGSESQARAVILNKPDRLTDDEYEIIKTHPDVGRRLLIDHPLAALAESAVFAHHERPDGMGYPQQLPLEHISVDARIVGICDAFDAMTSTRPYRKGMPIERALDIIRDNLGTQFDTRWGELFMELGEVGKLDHIVGHSESGIPLHDCPMCGASIVIRRHQHEGDRAYCRACGAETRIRVVNGNAILEATGQRGSPAQLEPEVDTDLVRELVKESASLLNQQPST